MWTLGKMTSLKLKWVIHEFQLIYSAQGRHFCYYPGWGMKHSTTSTLSWNVGAWLITWPIQKFLFRFWYGLFSFLLFGEAGAEKPDYWISSLIKYIMRVTFHFLQNRSAALYRCCTTRWLLFSESRVPLHTACVCVVILQLFANCLLCRNREQHKSYSIHESFMMLIQEFE